jgi:hypothetical protein
MRKVWSLSLETKYCWQKSQRAPELIQSITFGTLEMSISSLKKLYLNVKIRFLLALYKFYLVSLGNSFPPIMLAWWYDLPAHDYRFCFSSKMSCKAILLSPPKFTQEAFSVNCLTPQCYNHTQYQAPYQT